MHKIINIREVPMTKRRGFSVDADLVDQNGKWVASGSIAFLISFVKTNNIQCENIKA